MGSDAGHVPVLARRDAGAPRGETGRALGGRHAWASAATRRPCCARRAPDGRLLGLDRDGETLERARARLAPFGDRARLEHADYREIPERLGGERADGILLDLGVSSAPARRRRARLQLPGARARSTCGWTGASGDDRGRAREPHAREGARRPDLRATARSAASRRIARAIVRARERAPIRTTTRARRDRAPRGAPRPPAAGLHPATRTFQALRIRVNRELDGLGRGPRARSPAACAPGGRLAVIAFHSPRGPRREAGLPRARRRAASASSQEAGAARPRPRSGRTRARAARGCARSRREEDAA